jgi:hypothetical protein
MSAYAIALPMHSYLRWVVLFVGILLAVRSFTAWRRKRSWQAADERLHLLFVATSDTQLTTGLLLYVFFSPLPGFVFANFGNAIQDSTLRFFGMEHGLAMGVTATILHVGRVQSRRATTDVLRYCRVWTTTLVVLVLIAAAIPWPGLQHVRPLFRTGGTAELSLTGKPDGKETRAVLPSGF